MLMRGELQLKTNAPFSSVKFILCDTKRKIHCKATTYNKIYGLRLLKQNQCLIK